VARPRSVTDEQVLAGTAVVLWRIGPDRLTLADVGAETGLKPPTLLQRFESKRGLLLACLEWLAGSVDSAFAAGTDPQALVGLENGLLNLIAGIETPEELAHHLAFFQSGLDDPAFQGAAVRRAAAIRARVKELLDAAVQSGELVRCQTARVARAVETTYHGALLNWTIHREGEIGVWLRADLDLLLLPYKPLAPSF
jgi:AcrR family transcriptional regulator